VNRVLALVVLAAFLGSCGTRSDGGSDGGSNAQGVRGVVVAGPQCPVESAESPCPPEPLTDFVVQILRGGDVVAQVATDADGRFSADVDAGTYSIRPAPGQQGFVSAKPVRAVVRSGSFSDVTLYVDTGIR
jgi:hypothetical protein